MTFDIENVVSSLPNNIVSHLGMNPYDGGFAAILANGVPLSPSSINSICSAFYDSGSPCPIYQFAKSFNNSYEYALLGSIDFKNLELQSWQINRYVHGHRLFQRPTSTVLSLSIDDLEGLPWGDLIIYIKSNEVSTRLLSFVRMKDENVDPYATVFPSLFLELNNNYKLALHEGRYKLPYNLLWHNIAYETGELETVSNIVISTFLSYLDNKFS